MSKILKATPFVLILFGLGACISEPFSRNCVRVLFLIFFAALWTKRFSFQNLAPYSRILALMTAFIAWLGVSYVLGGMTVPLAHNSIEWILFSHDMFIFLLMGLMIREEKFLTVIMVALGLSLIIDNIYIFHQVLQGVDRPKTFLHGSIMQGTMLYIILLPAFLVMTLRQNVTFARRIFDGTIFFTSLAAFIMLNTRGAWLAMAIVLPFILICSLRSRKKIISASVLFIVLGGLFLIVSPRTFERLHTFTTVTSEQSVSERFLMWRSALYMIEDHPLTGVGLGNYETQYREKYILNEATERKQGHAHNVYLQFWAETGLPGLILYFALFGYILFWSWRHSGNFYGLMLFTATLDLVLYSLTDYTFASFSAMRVYWLVFGFCVVGIRFNKQKKFQI